MECTNKNWINKIRNVLMFILFITLGVALTTYLSVGRIEGSIIGLIIHVFFKISLVSLLIFVTKKPKKSFIFYNGAEFIFGVINFLKISTRSQPLEPWDLSFVDDLGNIASFMDVGIAEVGLIFLTLIFFVAITLIDLYAFEQYCDIPSKKGKMIILCMALPILLFLCAIYMKINVKYIEPNQKGFSNYTHYGRTNEYGAMVNFFLDLSMIGWEKVELPYSEEALKNIYEQESTKLVGEEEYDNVIILLLESYYDINELGIFEFKENPLKNYYEYAEKNGKTKLLVDNIGGGTSNVEYQILTMHDLEMYNEGVYPYIHSIKKEIAALPRVFKNNNYKTTAIHNYEKRFYNREAVYQYMGIDTFFAGEDFENAEEGPDGFVSDREIYEKIVELIEEEERSFITAITIGGHPPYGGYYFDEYAEWYENEQWSNRLTLSVNNYLQKLRNSDALLGDLIEYINNSEEKTLLIAYGDHFPMLYKLLEKSFFADESEKNLTLENYPELFEVPYIVYSNVQKEIKIKEKIEVSEVGMYILENVKLNYIGPVYNAIHRYFKGEEVFGNYQLIQYDNVQGEQFWRKYNNK